MQRVQIPAYTDRWMMGGPIRRNHPDRHSRGRRLERSSARLQARRRHRNRLRQARQERQNILLLPDRLRGDMTNSLHFAGSDLYSYYLPMNARVPYAMRCLTAAHREMYRTLSPMCGSSSRGERAITGNARRCLRGYGAWDETELADATRVADRLVWLTGWLCTKAARRISPPIGEGDMKTSGKTAAVG